MQLKRPFLSEVQWARALALFAVLFVHSTSTGMGASTPFSLPYTGYSILNIAGKIGTSTFIFLSSFILFYTYYPREFTTKLFTSFYKNRLLYILVPYIVFSIFYFALRYDINGFQLTWPEIIAKFTDELLSGNAYTHLYFVNALDFSDVQTLSPPKLTECLKTTLTSKAFKTLKLFLVSL